MPATTGAEIVANTKRWPLRTVKYRQNGTKSPTGHRPDCSGYVSMCLGLPTPGENTVTLVTEKHVREIGWNELQPGDIVGKMGTGTAGDLGHAMVVIGIAAQFYTVSEQRGPTGAPGPTTRTIANGFPAGYKPYRSNYLIGETDVLYGKLHTEDSVYCSNGVEYRPVSRMSNIVGGENAIRSFATLEEMEDYLGKPYRTPNSASFVAHVHNSDSGTPVK